MSPNFHPDHILSTFETQAISMGVDPEQINKGDNPQIEFVTEQKTSQEDKIRDKIVNYVSANKVDVLFIGSYGAKVTMHAFQSGCSEHLITGSG